MKILFYGDSITDASRSREDGLVSSLGYGYVRDVAATLYNDEPLKYEILNRGISGNRVVDLYSRVKVDCWNLKPDVLSILIGVNDVWHEIGNENGVELPRFEKVYRMLIEDTKERLPDLKIVLCEPFVLEGFATENTEEVPDKFSRFQSVYEYAKVVKKLAEEYGLYFLPLQERISEMAEKYNAPYYLRDGVHPAIAGAKLIADEWVKLFKKGIDK